MTLRLRQSAEYQGDNRWNWSVWIDGPSEQLDDVESVTYHLHPTFPDPIRVVTDRSSMFKLDASGWGSFAVIADIKPKHGRVTRRVHNLVLEYPAEEVTSSSRSPAGKNRVFIASSVADRAVESALRDLLEREGFAPVSESDIPTGVPFENASERALRSIDAAIAVVSDVTSPYMEAELEMARQMKVPILPIRVGRGREMPESLRDVHALRVKDATEIRKVAPDVIDGLHRILS